MIIFSPANYNSVHLLSLIDDIRIPHQFKLRCTQPCLELAETYDAPTEERRNLPEEILRL
jgi:hypothetical protein